VALMVVDTSAIVAILFNEPDAALYANALASGATRLISAVTRVELAFVMEGRKGELGRADLERFLEAGGFEVVAVTPIQAMRAIDAFRRFGRGRHSASLNIGDCFSYALAATFEEALLFKGNDFARTDLRSALQSN
jgi:ribonuclease VapC